MSRYQVASSPPLGGVSSSADLLALLGVAFDLSAVAMILVDDALRVVNANPAANRMLATDPLVGRSLAEFGMIELTRRAGRRDVDLLGGEPHGECETEMTASTGQAVRAQVHLDAVVAPSGKHFYLAQFRDITAERRQSDELADSELRYRQLVETLPNTAVMLFDHDLRLVLAAGEALSAHGYDPRVLTGRLMVEVLPKRAMDILEPHYRVTLDGRSVDFEYDSPTMGRRFRVRTRPVTDRTGMVIGGLVMAQDVSDESAHHSTRTQTRELDQLGSCWYDRVSGWSFDTELLEIWGRDPRKEHFGFPAELVPLDESASTLLSWEKVISISGRHTLSYRIRHGRTGQLRHLESTYETIVDRAGAPLRVVATHLDVTDVVTARALAERERTSAAMDRRLVLRRVGDMLTTSRVGPAELMTSIVNLAAAAVGDGAAIRVLSADHQEVERDFVAHPDDRIRRRFEASLHRTAAMPVTFDGLLTEVVGLGKLVSRSGRGGSPTMDQPFTERIFDQTEHFMIAPLRHNGTVLGMLAVFRTDRERPYQPADEDILQVLADGAGAAIAEIRARQAAERERDSRLSALREQQHELLEKLAGMEARERSQLAESIHDEPIQRLVAGMLRLDNLSIRMDETTRDELDRVATQLELAVDWLRNLIVVALSPPDLADGLGQALAGLANGIFAGTNTTFMVDGPDHVGLSLPAKEAAYRIFREALVNVRKHAKAAAVTLRLENRDGEVELTLTDDGVGCTKLDGGPGHLGMSTMRARADAEGGNLRIESVPGLGTVVTLTLPSQTGEHLAATRAAHRDAANHQHATNHQHAANHHEGDSGESRRGGKGVTLS